MSVKLLTMQRSVPLKKKTTKNHEHSLVHHRHNAKYIHNKNNNITFTARARFYHIVFYS